MEYTSLGKILPTGCSSSRPFGKNRFTIAWAGMACQKFIQLAFSWVHPWTVVLPGHCIFVSKFQLNLALPAAAKSGSWYAGFYSEAVIATSPMIKKTTHRQDMQHATPPLAKREANPMTPPLTQLQQHDLFLHLILFSAKVRNPQPSWPSQEQTGLFCKCYLSTARHCSRDSRRIHSIIRSFTFKIQQHKRYLCALGFYFFCASLHSASWCLARISCSGEQIFFFAFSEVVLWVSALQQTHIFT